MFFHFCLYKLNYPGIFHQVLKPGIRDIIGTGIFFYFGKIRYDQSG